MVITRTLVQCKPVKIATVVSGTKSFERDPKHHYVIHHRTLANGWKTSDLSVEFYPNGMLKQVGAEAKDETGEIVFSVATSIASLSSRT
jgi:hypothetical protein